MTTPKTTSDHFTLLGLQLFIGLLFFIAGPISLPFLVKHHGNLTHSLVHTTTVNGVSSLQVDQGVFITLVVPMSLMLVGMAVVALAIFRNRKNQ